MKGKLLTVFFSLAILVGLSTSAFSQAIVVNFQEELIDPVTTSEVTSGTAYLIIEASTDTITNGIQAPDITNPYFLSNGDMYPNDIPSTGVPALTSYYNYGEFGMSFPSEGQSQIIELNPSIYQTGGEFSFFVRVFNNLKGNALPGMGLPDASFDQSGNYLGDPSLLDTTYYFDTAIMTLVIPPAPDKGYLTFNIGGGDQNWIPIINTEPVPEPGAMFLMAAGLLWFGRKLKRK